MKIKKNNNRKYLRNKDNFESNYKTSMHHNALNELSSVICYRFQVG